MKKIMLQLVYLMMCVAVASAKLEYGACPTGISGIWPFDLSMFSGRWYVTHEMDKSEERCNAWTFSLNNDNQSYSVYNTAIRYDKILIHTGTAKQSSSEEGELSVSFKDDGWLQSARNYIILMLNSEEYAVVYTCTTRFWFFRTRRAWVLNRQRNITDMNSSVTSSFEPYGMSESDFYPVNQENCSF
uniref:Lipocalin/cytosolic fatty-acid binding domain-containing protein n=1 Tax=Clastoptera arizonana TaxID=38151 RepID=A0A1B6EH71_9HEMI